MFLDASAIVAIIVSEEGHQALIGSLEKSGVSYYSAMSAYESVLAIARIQNGGLVEARHDLAKFLTEFGSGFVVIDAVISEEAIAAHERFGKGIHKARLNMGDCFSYACAKVLKVPLLCKGDDFIHTDIRIA
jgi:ribonuclease VapC